MPKGSIISCPSCDIPMVPRKNRFTGNCFWGCPNYPKCTHTFSDPDSTTLEKEWERYQQIKEEMRDLKIATAISGDITLDTIREAVKEVIDNAHLPKVLPTNPRIVLKEQQQMATAKGKNSGVVNGAKSTANVMKDSLVNAGKCEIGSAMADGTVALMKHYAGDAWPKFFDSPGGQAVAKMFIPGMIHMLCESFGETIPLASQAKDMATLAIEGTSRETVHQARVAAQPFLADLVALGAGLGATALQSGAASGALPQPSKVVEDITKSVGKKVNAK